MTVTEVHQWLGPATYREQAASGRVVETFETLQTIFGRYGVPEREEALEIRQFSVRYDSEGRVLRSLYHRGVLEGFTMLFSRSLGTEIPSDALVGVRPGQTGRAELERKLGAPTLVRLDADQGERCEWIYESVEAAAVVAARTYRALEVVLDETGTVVSVKSVDRVFPTWRR